MQNQDAFTAQAEAMTERLQKQANDSLRQVCVRLVGSSWSALERSVSILGGEA